ncbi:MAG: NUDIX hydrolase [Acidimicrobiales bacterium]|nr:NUDIX hydrolase [Acidimicrobiales bacterium]
MSRPLVRAAGTVPWRIGDAGPEVLVVHRPHYGDWTVPKGKLDPGEGWADAAVRETEEETGFVGELGPQLCATAYAVTAGPKLVRYWLLRVAGGRFSPNDEVDEIRWLPVDQARSLVLYPTDRAVLGSAAAQLAQQAETADGTDAPPSSVIV